MKTEGVVIGFLLCLWAVSLILNDVNSTDKAINEKIAIIQNAKNSDNPAVIASAKNAQIELQALQQKKAEEVKAEQKAESEKPQTEADLLTRALISAVAVALSILVVWVLFQKVKMG